MDFIQEVLVSEFIDDGVSKVTGEVQGLALILGGGFMIMSYGYYMMKGILNIRSGFREVVSKLLRSFILMFLIGAYPLIFGAVANLADLINGYTAPSLTNMVEIHDKMLEDRIKKEEGDYTESLESESRYQNLDGATQTELDEAKQKQAAVNETVEEDEDDFWGFETEMKKLTYYLNPMRFFHGIRDAIFLAIFFGVRVIISAVAITMIKVMYVIGPLSIAFSMIPAFQDKLSKWFGLWTNCLLVFTTMNIIDHVVYNVMLDSFYTDNHWEGNSPALTNFYLGVLIVYCLSFWLTAHFVGSESAGKVLSTGVAAATAAIGAIVGGATGGAGAAVGKAGSAAGSAAKVGQDTLRKSRE